MKKHKGFHSQSFENSSTPEENEFLLGNLMGGSEDSDIMSADVWQENPFEAAL